MVSFTNWHHAHGREIWFGLGYITLFSNCLSLICLFELNTVMVTVVEVSTPFSHCCSCFQSPEHFVWISILRLWIPINLLLVKQSFPSPESTRYSKNFVSSINWFVDTYNISPPTPHMNKNKGRGTTSGMSSPRGSKLTFALTCPRSQALATLYTYCRHAINRVYISAILPCMSCTQQQNTKQYDLYSILKLNLREKKGMKEKKMAKPKKLDWLAQHWALAVLVHKFIYIRPSRAVGLQIPVCTQY